MILGHRMIKEIKKDITTVNEGLIIHGCNCSGGFGSGVAGAIRKKMPWVYAGFKKNGTGKHLLGTISFYNDPNNENLVVGNAYTQMYYGRDGKKYANLDAIEKTISLALEFAKNNNLDVFMPKIGCGLGGLSWNDEVKPIILYASQKYPEVNIFVCDI